jgi:hypothetical protein
VLAHPDRRRGRPPGRHGRGPLVRLAVLAAGAALLPATAGCSQVDAALSKQWASVVFRRGTPPSDLATVFASCGHLKGLHVREVRSGAGTVTGISVHGPAGRFTSHDLTELYGCLQRFPAVTGVAMKQVKP